MPSIDLYQPIFGSTLIEWFSTYGYLVMLLLLIIEGRVIGLIAAALAHLGYWNIFMVWALLILASAISDTVYYFLGRYGSHAARKFWLTRFISQKIQSYAGSGTTKNFFEKHGMKTFFLSKSVSSLSWPLQLTAGAAGMSIRKYYIANITGGLVWSTVFVGLGYFMGYLAQIINIYVAIALAIVIVITLFFISREVADMFAKDKLFTNNRE